MIQIHNQLKPRRRDFAAKQTYVVAAQGLSSGERMQHGDRTIAYGAQAGYLRRKVM